MIEVLILGAIFFVLSLIFDKTAKNSKSKIKDKLKMASLSWFSVVGWGIVIIVCVALFLIICRFLILGDIKGFFK